MSSHKKSCATRRCVEEPIVMQGAVTSLEKLQKDVPDRWWSWAAFGCNTTIQMMESYAKSGMPGNGLQFVRHLHTRISTLIEYMEKYPNGEPHAKDSL